MANRRGLRVLLLGECRRGHGDTQKE
jgi:hypothetical protein